MSARRWPRDLERSPCALVGIESAHPGALALHMSVSGSTRAFAMAVARVDASGDVPPLLRHRRLGEAYGASIAGSVTMADDVVRVRFELPGTLEADFVELAIPVLPGIYRIGPVSLDGALLPDLARRVISVHEQRLDHPDPGMVRILSDAGRPSLEVDLRASGATRRTVLEVDIVRERAVSSLVEEVRRGSAAIASLLQELDARQGDAAFAHADIQDRNAAALRQQEVAIQALSTELAALAAAHAALAPAVEAHVASAAAVQAAAGERLQQQVEALTGTISAALADAAARQQGLQRTLDDAVVRLARLAEDGNARADMDRRTMAELQAEVAHVTWSIQNVFWRRWLRPVRRLLRGGA